MALYDSLLQHCESFHLYIYSFDEESYIKLKSLNLQHATIVPLVEFETKELLNVKESRTIAEYCWTCTASTIWHTFKHYKVDHCTYLDADMLFFSNPEPIFNEIGERAIAFTEHDFSSNLKASEIYGKYCVQFMYFKNTTIGLHALDWWRLQCIEWCFAKLEIERYADQKYLEFFEEKFGDVCIIKNIGCGVAPWNISNYKEVVGSENNFKLRITHKNGLNGELIFYHFQGLKIIEKENVILSEASVAPIKKVFLELIYKPYIHKVVFNKYQLLGERVNPKPIVFHRPLKVALSLFIKQQLKQFIWVRYLFYKIKRNRYSRPKNIE